jgi:hypothetical protein
VVNVLSALFGRRPRSRRPHDRVWQTREAKLRALLTSGARIVAHFPETRRALQSLARAADRPIEVDLAGNLTAPESRDAGLEIVVAERHPLREHDERVVAWADAAAGSIVFHVSLEDPPLSSFVGDSLRPLLDRLGASPDAPLEHALISRSIEKAQERVKREARVDLPADTAEGWMRAAGLQA